MKGNAAPRPAALADVGRLLEEHRPELLAMLQRRIDPHLAVRLDPEDVLGEAFLQAQRRWEWFQEQEGLTAYVWLYGIARDCLREAWRRESRDCRDNRRDLPFPEESSLQLAMSLFQKGQSPAEQAAREELRECMRRALQLLGEADRDLLWMRNYDQLSFAEIAQLLGVKENAAAVRYVRALKRLRLLWEKLYPSEGVER
jgi:RNA polymerase sigma-70 factor (ECF subfamily)